MPVVALHWKDLDQSNVVGSASYGYVLKINEPLWLYSGMTSINCAMVGKARIQAWVWAKNVTGLDEQASHVGQLKFMKAIWLIIRKSLFE